jgi:hypothetical protein
MKTPFTTDQFYQVFERYNSTVFPAQLIFLILGVAALFLILSEKSYKSKLTAGFIGILWIWMGLIYHIAFFTAINEAAYVFGLIFIFEGILIILNSGNNRITFSFKPTTKVYTGLFFIIFGLIVYPVIGLFIHGTSVPVISLGLPCPTTIFTFGFFMLAGSKLPKYLLIIPSLWAVVGLSAAINFGVYQDFMIFIAAVFLWVPAFSRSRE